MSTKKVRKEENAEHSAGFDLAIATGEKIIEVTLPAAIEDLRAFLEALPTSFAELYDAFGKWSRTTGYIYDNVALMVRLHAQPLETADGRKSDLIVRLTQAMKCATMIPHGLTQEVTVFLLKCHHMSNQDRALVENGFVYRLSLLFTYMYNGLVEVAHLMAQNIKSLIASSNDQYNHIHS